MHKCRLFGTLSMFACSKIWGYTGPFWTFEKKVARGTYTRARLDRVLASPEWTAEHTLAQVRHLTAASSDHCPILVEFDPGDTVPHQIIPFRYEVMWEHHDSWDGLISGTWGRMAKLLAYRV